jgi:hypothetical protein
MISNLPSIRIGVALLIAASSPAGAAETMGTPLDDYNIRRAIILKCHQGQDAADRAFLAKGDALRRAALEQLWAQLDAADPLHHNENGKKADDMLQLRQAARDFDIQEQANEYGCAWLDGRIFSAPR